MLASDGKATVLAGEWLELLRRHEHRERHLDELLIAVDGRQGAADIVGGLRRAALLYPVFESSRIAASRAIWFSLILRSSEGSRSELGIANPP